MICMDGVGLWTLGESEELMYFGLSYFLLVRILELLVLGFDPIDSDLYIVCRFSTDTLIVNLYCCILVV